MDVTDTLNKLKRLSLSELKRLPSSDHTEIVDDIGRNYQRVVWCEQIGDDKFRILVSLHRMYPLGAHTVVEAEGFTVDAEGNMESIEPEEIDNLMD